MPRRAFPSSLLAMVPALLLAACAEPEYGVAPGQAAVIYAGERVVGGGWIEATETALK